MLRVPIVLPIKSNWDGAEGTTLLAPEEFAQNETSLVPVDSSLTDSGLWVGDEDTPLLGVKVPHAHQQITAHFTPFLDHKSTSRPAVAEVVVDGWHKLGRAGTLTGQAFGDYELGGILGEGGMGVIYRASQRSLGRRVAVKTLSSVVGQDPILRSRFEIEARAAGLIRSPHVVQVYAAGSHNDTAYFVMEFIDGQHLGEVLREHIEIQRRISIELVAQWMLHASRGLAAAAQHGVVHRDIKPSNLLISKEVLKIADFGISRIQGESQLTRTGTAIGTPSYVSPEQGRGEPCDARSDLYSLGVVFYECLTGRKPFVGDTANAVIYQHCYSEPKMPREVDPLISEQWQAVVMRCLQKNPEKRYQNANDLAADIERVQAGNMSITAVFNARYGTGADEAMRRYLGRSRRWVAPFGMALMGVVILVIGGVWWWFGQAAERAAERHMADQLRSELKNVLDVLGPAPIGASADIERLAILVGKKDPDVRRWNSRLEKIQELYDRLSCLDHIETIEAQILDQAKNDLAHVALLIGTNFPAYQRWTALIQEKEMEITRLRAVLAVLDSSPMVNMSQSEDTASDRITFSRLVGPQDADLVRWNKRIAESVDRQDFLRKILSVLDDPVVVLPELQTRQLLEQLIEFQALRFQGVADLDGVRWASQISLHQQRLDSLRKTLKRLEDPGRMAADLQTRLAFDLHRYELLVQAEDADLLHWKNCIRTQENSLQALRNSMAPLDMPEDLRGSQLVDLRNDLNILVSLSEVNDVEVKEWNSQLLEIEKSIVHDQEIISSASHDEVMSQAQAKKIRISMEALSRRDLLSEDHVAQLRLRLFTEESHISELKKHLTVIDGNDVELTSSLVDEVLYFGTLAGIDDVDYLRWHKKISTAIRLREELFVLDQAHPVPDQVDRLIAEYNLVFPKNESQVKVWKNKVERVEFLRQSLSALNRSTPAPLNGSEQLAELERLIGPFSGSEVWRIKINKIRDVHEILQRDLSEFSVLLDPNVSAQLAHLKVLEGDTGPDFQRWSQRLVVLQGPGRPAWASRYSVDDCGPLARLQLSGDPELFVDFRYLPPATGVLGSPLTEVGRDDDEGQVVVTRTFGCWLAVHECTQAVYSRIIEKNSGSQSGSDQPVERVNWDEVQYFLDQLRKKIPEFEARLPRESEWEHAVRLGEPHSWFGPRGAISVTDVVQVAWFSGVAVGEEGSHSVGRKQPNALGLFDLHGNVWEWCEDRYGPYSPVPISDPLGRESDLRVARGGSWGDSPVALRAANRLAIDPGLRSAYLGFRMACSAEGRVIGPIHSTTK